MSDAVLPDLTHPRGVNPEDLLSALDEGVTFDTPVVTSSPEPLSGPGELAPAFDPVLEGGIPVEAIPVRMRFQESGGLDTGPGNPRLEINELGAWMTDSLGNRTFDLPNGGKPTVDLTPHSKVPAAAITGQLGAAQIADGALTASKFNVAKLSDITPITGSVRTSDNTGKIELADNSISLHDEVGAAEGTITNIRGYFGGIERASLHFWSNGTYKMVKFLAGAASGSVNDWGDNLHHYGRFGDGQMEKDVLIGKIGIDAPAVGWKAITNGGCAATWIDSVPEVRFHANSDLNTYRQIAASGYRTGSDRRFKRDIRGVGGSLPALRRLRGVKFKNANPEAGDGDQLGLVAQEVAEHFPEVVDDGLFGDEEPHYRIDYNGLIAPIIESIKELASRLDAVERARSSVPDAN